MRCCGTRPDGISTQDDPVPVYMCPECGKSGPESDFAEPVPTAPPQYELTRVEMARLAVAGLFFRIAQCIAPNIN
jgi:hypothetical protein